MSTVPCINSKLRIENNGITYDLNVTARTMDSLPPEAHTEIIVRTVRLWLYIAKAIQLGETQLLESLAYRSVEMSLEGEEGFEGFVFEHYGEMRCTVFDWNRQIDMTLHSNSLPQAALDLWLAMRDAKAELATAYNVSESAPQAPPARSTPAASTNTPTAPAAPQNEVIVATRAPNSNRLDYAEGQLVSIDINKIVVGTHEKTGSVMYKLWGPIGREFALYTIFVTGTDGKNSKNYNAAAATLEALGLSFSKTSVEGNWQLICKASNDTKGDVTKQYLNCVSLTAV